MDDDDAHGLCFNEVFIYIDDDDAHRLCFNEFLFTLMMMMHMVYASMSFYLH